MSSQPFNKVLLLAGGVGGAKLAHGFALLGLADRLTVIVNTADDFELFGLSISPDLDTVLYTLAGIANPQSGWGIVGDTANTLSMLGRYGEPTWFWLGDRDLATHILRTARLRSGQRLTDITRDLAQALGVQTHILPMSDDPIRTIIVTPDGELPFQEYFVRRRQQDRVLAVRLQGIEQARLTPEAEEALAQADLVVLAPSNPIVSIGPILAVADFRERLRRCSAPVLAVSPIIAGRALKGPADRMLASLGHEVSPLGVARLYADLLHGFVLDYADAHLASRVEALRIRPFITDIIMREISDRTRLALEIFTFAQELRGSRF